MGKHESALERVRMQKMRAHDMKERASRLLREAKRMDHRANQLYNTKSHAGEGAQVSVRAGHLKERAQLLKTKGGKLLLDTMVPHPGDPTDIEIHRAEETVADARRQVERASEELRAARVSLHQKESEASSAEFDAQSASSDRQSQLRFASYHDSTGSHLESEAADLDERRESEENAAMALKRKSERLAARADKALESSGSEY